MRNRWRIDRFFGMVRPALEGSLRSRFFILAAIAFAVALSASACNNQGEGERCDTNDGNNGNDDCSSGLQCDSAAALGGAVASWATGVVGFGLCCPTNRAQATSSLCEVAAVAPGGTPAPPPADAGSDASSSSDSGTDASSDAPADSPADAPLDAPLDSSGDSAAD